jgi:predicted RNase H-like nuclease
MFVGLDGYRKGWVAVWLDEHEQAEITFLDSMGELFDRPFMKAMVDIPIGLPESGYRTCDEEGKNYLGRNSSRVFTGARRHCFHIQEEKMHMLGPRLLMARAFLVSSSAC